ncbi:MAG: type II secretion system protein GspG, partial [Gammaproteobacteria bacterium]|nr:type II secretion system protein GspG [Gammaproteobacteria bacterium]
ALAMYRLDTARLPTTAQGLAALVQKPDDPAVRNWRSGGYMARLSRDPWGSEYRYRQPSTRGPGFDLYSLGPDGLEGSPDTDEDNIGNWSLGN